MMGLVPTAQLRHLKARLQRRNSPTVAVGNVGRRANVTIRIEHTVMQVTRGNGNVQIGGSVHTSPHAQRDDVVRQQLRHEALMRELGMPVKRRRPLYPLSVVTLAAYVSVMVFAFLLGGAMAALYALGPWLAGAALMGYWLHRHRRRDDA